MEGEISQDKLKEEVVAPYKQNWIGLISVGMIVLAVIVKEFPELLNAPSIPIPDLWEAPGIYAWVFKNLSSNSDIMNFIDLWYEYKNLTQSNSGMCHKRIKRNKRNYQRLVQRRILEQCMKWYLKCTDVYTEYKTLWSNDLYHFITSK